MAVRRSGRLRIVVHQHTGAHRKDIALTGRQRVTKVVNRGVVYSGSSGKRQSCCFLGICVTMDGRKSVGRALILFGGLLMSFSGAAGKGSEKVQETASGKIQRVRIRRVTPLISEPKQGAVSMSMAAVFFCMARRFSWIRTLR